MGRRRGFLRAPHFVERPAGAASSQEAHGFLRIALFATGIVALANVALQWRAVSSVCAATQCRQPQLSASGAASLASAGLSLAAWSTVTAALSLLLSAALIAMSVLVLTHSRGRPRAVVPLVLLLAAAGLGSAFLPWSWLAAGLGGAGVLGVFWFLATYPTGAFEPAWAVAPFVAALAWVAVTLAPEVGPAVAEGRQPWVLIYGLGFAVCVAGTVSAQVVRYRRGDRETRRALGAVTTSLGVLVAFGAGWSVWSGTHAASHGVGTLPSALAALVANVLLVLVLAAAVTGVVSRDTYVVRLLVDRVLGAAVVLTVAGIAYGGSVLALSALHSGWLAHAGAGVATAVLVGGLLRWIVTGVDRLIFGEIGDPRRLTADITARAVQAQEASGLLADVLDMTAQRFYLPALALSTGTNVADEKRSSQDQRPAAVERVELGATAHACEEGAAPPALLVRLPPGRLRLSSRERRALHAVAPAILSCVSAVSLAEELQRSRVKLAAAVAEERRSIRRELHDELGQLLASARNRVAAARAGLPDQSGDVDTHLGRADLALSESVEWVRMLARALRPPLLDDEGLAAAIRAAGADLGLDVTVTDDIRDLSVVPGAAETAVYRMVIEALVNVSRHAGTREAAVHLSIDADQLLVVVRDEGAGAGGPLRSGVGLTSMRERVDELGGSVSVTSETGVGTRVEIRLPTRERRARTDSDPHGVILGGTGGGP